MRIRAWSAAEISNIQNFKSTLRIVRFNSNNPVPNLIKASNVLLEIKYNSLNVKKPDNPIPPRVIWNIPIKTNSDDIHAKEKLLNDNLALIGVGHGCSGFTLLMIFDDSLKTERS